MLFMGIFLLTAALFSAPAKAAELISPTVQVLGVKQYLNGQIDIVSAGSGTIISSNGEVLTNAHVVYDSNLNRPYDAFAVCISTDPEEIPECRFTATLKRYDELIDLAILKIDVTPSWGGKPSSFSSISYSNLVDPKVGDTVTVHGYPASGGGTINLTKGQISGYTEINGYQYLKTDADIDTGNSGGAMFSDAGVFIGVPSYIVSHYENSGRVLHISEVKEWIDSGAGYKGIVNSAAKNKLREKWARFYKAEEEGELIYKTAPKLHIVAPDGWEFLLITDSMFSLYKKNNPAAVIVCEVSSNGFKLDMNPQDKLNLIQRMRDEKIADYQFMKIQSADALHYWEESPDTTIHVISFSQGHKDIDISYTIPKNDEFETLKEVNAFLDNFAMASPDIDDPNPRQVLDEPSYPFSLETPLEWRVVLEDLEGNDLAYILSNTHKLEWVKLQYSEIPEGTKEIDPKDGLEYEMENYIPEDAKVFSKSTQIEIDGLPGWMVQYKFEIGEISMKKASVTILDDDYELYFDYKAEIDIYDEGLRKFATVLKSVKTKANEGKGSYNIPLPGGTGEEGELSDIIGHRYEASIRELLEMEVLGGYPDGSFKPENSVNRAEALKTILQSLRARQKESGAETFVMPENFNQFSDLKASEWYATYVAEGVDKGIVNGYPDGTFKGGNTVNLAEALKMTLEAHDMEVWEGDTSPWHKKYFDTAYSLDLLPQDLSDPAKLLTRAELSYIVGQLTSR